MAVDFAGEAKESIQLAIGRVGRIILTGQTELTPPAGYYIFCIIPSSDMVISSYDNRPGYVEEGDLTDITSFLTGMPIYGEFTSLTLSEGDGIGYLARG